MENNNYTKFEIELAIQFSKNNCEPVGSSRSNKEAVRLNKKLWNESESSLSFSDWLFIEFLDNRILK